MIDNDANTLHVMAFFEEDSSISSYLVQDPKATPLSITCWALITLQKTIIAISGLIDFSILKEDMAFFTQKFLRYVFNDRHNLTAWCRNWRYFRRYIIDPAAFTLII